MNIDNFHSELDQVLCMGVSSLIAYIIFAFCGLAFLELDFIIISLIGIIALLAWIVFGLLFNPLLIKALFLFLIESLYARNLKKAMVKAKNFLRPITKQPIGTYVFANKNCIVEINEAIIYCYNKENQQGFEETIFKNCKKIILLTLCDKFNFKTAYGDVLSIIANYIAKDTLTIHENTLPHNKISEYKIPCLNNLSVAELICLPGINMGKAYKIHKYLKTNDFRLIEQFVNFADISKEDKHKILKDKYLYTCSYYGLNKI